MVEQLDNVEKLRRATRFGGLDTLRGFAAVAVVWHHCIDNDPSSVGESSYFSRGIGVTTFFVISGFLITRILLREQEKTGNIALARFWIRRALRIFPLYFVMLGVYVLLVATKEHGTEAGDLFWKNLPYYATFTTNWRVGWEAGTRIIFYFAWSMAVQEQFYTLWPMIMKALPRRHAFLFPLACLIAADISSQIGSPPGAVPGLLRRIVVSLDTPIFFGVAVAMVLHSKRAWGFDLVRKLAGRIWSLPLGLALVLLPRWVPSIPRDLLTLSICYVVVACVLAPPVYLKIVTNPLAAHVGSVSYGIYLLHSLVLNMVGKVLHWPPPGILFAVGFPIVVLLATLSNRYLERPFMRLRDHAPARPLAETLPAAAIEPAETPSPASLVP